MTRTFLTLLSALALVFPIATAQGSSPVYSLRIMLGGQALHWDAGEGVTRNGDLLTLDDLSQPLTVYFEGGRLELNLADYGTFAQPHVTGFRFIRGADPETFSMGATVRHTDKGFDDYTDTLVFEGADNGRLLLTEALGGPQAFTRSKDNVRATGEVRISALDNVRSGEGSAIVVDFSQEPFSKLERGNLRYELTPQSGTE